PIAQRVGYIPAHAHENDVLGKMGPFEADRHRRSPSLCTLSHRGRAYPKSTQMKIATKPLHLPTTKFGGMWYRIYCKQHRAHDALARMVPNQGPKRVLGSEAGHVDHSERCTNEVNCQ